MEFNANVTEITENSVIYEKNGKVTEIPNDHVFAMIGYHPDYDFLESIGIEINTNEYGTAPVHNKETFETNVENCYIRRNCAGNDNNAIFIENGKYHGGIITQSILSKSKHHLKVKDRSIKRYS